MDDSRNYEQLAAIGCMVQSLTDQFGASQRDRPPVANRPASSRLPDAATTAMLAELVMMVKGLRDDFDSFRHELRTQIRTESIVVEDGVRVVAIAPGEITVERRSYAGEAHTGSFVHIQALRRGAEVQVGAAAHRRDDPGVSALLNANWEGPHPSATVGAYTDLHDDTDSTDELHVEDRSDRRPQR